MKWKERVALAMAVSVVVLTSVLVLDIGYAASRAEHGEVPGHILPILRHGRSRLNAGRQFQRQFLDDGPSTRAEAPDSASTTPATPASDDRQQATVSNVNNDEHRY